MKRIPSKLVAVLVVLVAVAGCNKDNDNNNTNTTNTVSSAELFNYSDSWGLLAAVKTVTYQTVPIIGQQEIILGTAVAAFPTTQGGTTYQDAGTVQCNTKTLTKQSNNAYVFQPSQTDVTGIDFSSGADWNISGAASIPPITTSFNSFPSTPSITSNKENVSLSSGYTFSISSVSNADSILFILASGSGYVQKRVGGNATSVTFSASDLSSLSASSYGLLQVTPYRYTTNTSIIPGKKVYLVNQVTVSDIASFE